MAIIRVNRTQNNFFIASRLARIKPTPYKPVPLHAFYKRKPNPKLMLPNVTIWAASWGTDQRMLDRTLRVLCYCRHNMKADRIIHFSRTPAPFNDCPWETIPIPELDMRSWNPFVNRVVPQYIPKGFAMSVHEDGFPLRFDLWQPEFLSYDYIGAPWTDGVVGNGGFNNESQCCLELEVSQRICRNRKAELEELGLRFAPRDLALEFSTETFGNQWPSFGYHGRNCNGTKHAEGWRLIDEFCK